MRKGWIVAFAGMSFKLAIGLGFIRKLFGKKLTALFGGVLVEKAANFEAAKA